MMIKSKQEIVASWVQQLRKVSAKVLVSNYQYDCLLTGISKRKTLIVFPEELKYKGIITIDKPLEQIELQDVIQLYTRINKS